MAADPTAELPDLNIILAGATVTLKGATEAEPARMLGEFHPIPLTLWKAIIGFHRRISILHRAESITLHRWHAGEQRYHTIIPHQVSAFGGLYVNYNPTDPRNQALFDEYGRTYRQEFFEGCCTIHTHVDAQAFESGTDAADEEKKPGWHITLGNLLSHDQYHMDFRMRLPDIPMIRPYLPTNRPYPLEWQHLFAEGVTPDQVFQEPGTTDWHKFTSRVTSGRDLS